MWNTILNFFDKLEDHVRAWLSRRPILYGIIGGLAAVLFFHGVWGITDMIGISPFVSLAISVIILLMTGLFVSNFVNTELIKSGIRRGKKSIDQTEEEVRREEEALRRIEAELHAVKEEVAHIEQAHHHPEDSK